MYLTGTVILAVLLAVICCPLLLYVIKHLVVMVRKRSGNDLSILDLDETAPMN